MKLTKDMMHANFEAARHNKAKFVFVAIDVNGYKEVICIPRASFIAKEIYYGNAYTDTLELKTNNDIKITGFTYGDAEALTDLI